MTKKITRKARMVAGCLVVSIPVEVAKYEGISAGDHVELQILKVVKG